MIKYSDNGSTLSAVNFPEVSLPLHGGRRLMHIHENRPGVLTALNKIFAEQGVNIAAQYLQTSAQMGYVVIDIEADEDVAEKALQAMKAILAPFAPVCCTDSPSLTNNGQVADLPVFLSLFPCFSPHLQGCAIAFVSLLEERNQSQINTLCLLEEDLRWRCSMAL